ncbi:hypothetical protein ABD91_17265 [Lysinibacillus sphaericus]|uniref:DUF2187 family protein n=1 Tax=Lysinibacillus sphaericus TaxID=1421 RepID=UPI0004D6EA3A|nr:DUF2187 family protein [Lysinibacillus sphaericus]KEK10225.1 hypothetical protein EP18_18800 [Lysinibacillus sphaericus]KEK11092.1 hypothetical protein EP18_14050 [Lysinibacillus sphaericus]MBG9692544.1 hypothetical protein [Lysinibacillus sphaericus]
MKKSTRVAKEGDIVAFTRSNFSCEGVVITVRSETVMVELQPEYIGMLRIPNNLTIVNHKNYQILNSDSQSLKDLVS